MNDFFKRVDPDKAKDLMKGTAKTTVKATFHFIRWIFVLLILIISILTVWGYFTSGTDFISTIATIGVGGFWGFFFGYFGWRLAESIEHYVMSKH